MIQFLNLGLRGLVKINSLTLVHYEFFENFKLGFKLN